MAFTLASCWQEVCYSRSGTAEESCSSGEDRFSLQGVGVRNFNTGFSDSRARAACQRSSLCCRTSSITKSSTCIDIRRSATLKSKSKGLGIYAASLRGRFPKTPVHLAISPPAWLQVARQQMRSSGKVDRFRKEVERGWAENEGHAPTFPLKNLNERLGTPNFRTEDADPWFLMELSIHCMYSKAYELEAEGLGFLPTDIQAVFSVPGGHDLRALAELWSCQSGLRFVMEPLVVAEGPDELIAGITDLQLKNDLRHFCLSHDKLAPSAKRTCRKELRAQVCAAIGDMEGCRFGTEWAPDRPRFAIIEISKGYIFGHVVYAPGPLEPSYSSAPRRWSAGIPVVLASIAVNIAGSAGDKLVDPCCGLGTILFEAKRRGMTAAGSDVSLGTLVNTANNFDHFKVMYSRSWGDFCSVFGPHNPRTKSSPAQACPCTELSSLTSALPTSTMQLNLSAVEVLPVGTRMVAGVVATAVGACQTEIFPAAAADRQDGVNSLPCSMEQNGRQPTPGLRLHQGRSEATGCESSSQSSQVEAPVSLAICDARTLDFVADCVVSNLPFGRFLTLEEGSIDSILQNLKGRARRYVFFFGSPLSPLLASAGYNVVREISVCPRNKRFMAVCTVFHPHHHQEGMERQHSAS